MPEIAAPGLGWHRDLPDPRDWTPQSDSVLELLEGLKTIGPSPRKPAAKVDLREFFPTPYDQGPLNSSTIHACTGLVQYFQRRVHGQIAFDPSRLFLYYCTRKLMGLVGDSGASFRKTFQALIQFGAPPEKFWPYDPDRFDDSPDAFLFTYHAEYRNLHYVRLDPPNKTGNEVLGTVRQFLAAGFPCVCGFPVPVSSTSPFDADIRYRPRFDSFWGGQGVVVVGYDDRRQRGTRGALLIRNSWGCGWGEEGYGWLPYAYVTNRLAVDFWTVTRADWLSSGEFQYPLS